MNPQISQISDLGPRAPQRCKRSPGGFQGAIKLGGLGGVQAILKPSVQPLPFFSVALVTCWLLSLLLPRRSRSSGSTGAHVSAYTLFPSVLLQDLKRALTEKITGHDLGGRKKDVNFAGPSAQQSVLDL